MIKEEIKCPNCGGNRYKEIKPDSFKCIYCGTVFTIENEKKRSAQNDLNKEDEERRFFAELGNGMKRQDISDINSQDVEEIKNIVEVHGYNPSPPETKYTRVLLLGLFVFSVILILLLSNL